MVGHLFMGHVSCLFPGHVAPAAVGLIGVVLADEGRLSMAGEATASEVGYPLFGRRRIVRVMTSGAGKPVSALSLALALQQRFPLAGRSAVGAQLAGSEQSESHSRRDPRPGTKADSERPAALTAVSPSR